MMACFSGSSTSPDSRPVVKKPKIKATAENTTNAGRLIGLFTFSHRELRSATKQKNSARRNTAILKPLPLSLHLRHAADNNGTLILTASRSKNRQVANSR